MTKTTQITIESIQSLTIDGLVGEVAWRGTGDDESDAAELHAEVERRMRLVIPEIELEWLCGPCGTPDVNGIIFSTFRAQPELWSFTGKMEAF